MGLIVPGGPDWAYCSHNISGTPVVGTVGAQVVSGVNDADGTAVTVLSALAHDVEYLRLLLSVLNAGETNDNNALLTLLIDPAGGTSWQTFVPYLYVGGLMGTERGTTTLGSGAPSGCYDLPIWIPAGASIGAMARQAMPSAAQTFKVFAQAFGGNRNPASWWCGQRVSTIGVDASRSTGQSHTPGNSGSFSSWANLGSPLGQACGALQFMSGGEFAFNGTWSEVFYQMEFGVAGNIIGPPLMRLITNQERGWWAPQGPIFKSLPAGTQLQVRGTGSTTAQAISAMAYAIH
ncbi:MAG: hypothetical protein SV862_00175 [Pseudomonadota bacterium]|nr:hypothetical protein [Pseudomonadota bacterium]